MCLISGYFGIFHGYFDNRRTPQIVTNGALIIIGLSADIDRPCNLKISPCYFSPLAEIPGPIELLENSLTYEGIQWRKIID